MCASVTTPSSANRPTWAIMEAMPSFRLFGIPVTIRPSFLIIAALLGFGFRSQLTYLVAWVLVVFVSILIHELGHALTARSYGAEVEIELNGIGGLTSWAVPGEELSPGRRALVAAAGSGVGVIFGGLVWVFDVLTGPYDGVVGFAVFNLIRVNVFWGLINWLPIRPLDGGHLFSSLLQKVTPSRAEMIGNVVFTLTAAGALVAGLLTRRIFLALLAGWLLMAELTRGRQTRPVAPIPPMTFDRPDPSPDGEADGASETIPPETEPEPEPGPRPEPEPER
jgi:stage IV sporulation protein FB